MPEERSPSGPASRRRRFPGQPAPRRDTPARDSGQRPPQIGPRPLPQPSRPYRHYNAHSTLLIRFVNPYIIYLRYPCLMLIYIAFFYLLLLAATKKIGCRANRNNHIGMKRRKLQPPAPLSRRKARVGRQAMNSIKSRTGLSALPLPFRCASYSLEAFLTSSSNGTAPRPDVTRGLRFAKLFLFCRSRTPVRRCVKTIPNDDQKKFSNSCRVSRVGRGNAAARGKILP